jgi:adenylate cyclase
VKKHWLLQIPWILLFAGCFAVIELGEQGVLGSRFLRETLWPILAGPTSSLTDLKFKVRGPQPVKNKIVVVEVDQSSIEALGRWPWHRDVVSLLLEKVFQFGPKTVGIDAVFSEKDPRVSKQLADFLKLNHLGDQMDQFETDRQLEKVITHFSDRLVLGWMSDTPCSPLFETPQDCAVNDPAARALFPVGFDKFGLTQMVVAPGFEVGRVPMLSFVTPIANMDAYHLAAHHAGFLNAAVDRDGSIRRSHLVAFALGKPFPSLALEMARVGLGEDLKVSLDQKQRIESLEFTHSGKKLLSGPLGRMQINFRGSVDGLTRVSALDVMSDAATIQDWPNGSKEVPRIREKVDLLRDAYVLVGVTGLGVEDRRPIPFDVNVPGVHVHAQVLDNILSLDPFVPSSGQIGIWTIAALMTLAMTLFAFGVCQMGAVHGLGLYLLTLFLTLLADFLVFFKNGYDLNLFYFYLELTFVFFANLALNYILEERRNKFIKGAFSKYVSPLVVEAIIKDPSSLALGGEKREVSILFSDIRGFTSFSERVDAKILSSFLNDYLSIMTEVIFKNRGTLDKYIGDAVMAFWGAPVSQLGHSYSVCRAGIEMMEALRANQERFLRQYGIQVNIGIGINTGLVNVGNMGSNNNFQYTVIGDQVNLASRVEGLTKYYGVRILATRQTLDSLEKGNLMTIPCRVLDEVKVKGKKQKVEVVQILDRPLPEGGLNLFAIGRQLYQSRRFDEAKDKFDGAYRVLSAAFGEIDIASQLFMERCQYFKDHPPPPDWDGSWVMENK